MTDLLETVVENRYIVQPNHTNTHGTAHGGRVVKWMDDVGAMAAMRFSGEACVTARMDQVNFEGPVPSGEIALVTAFVYDAGETSVDVRVEAFREDPFDGERELTTESDFVYVAVDEEYRPTSVPELTVGSEEAQELRDAALGEGTAMDLDDESSGKSVE
jgi:acyl-CoA hydrolase